MLKGIQKNMVWIKTPESRYFESAYFVMRSAQSNLPSDGDMLIEANRIIKNSDPKSDRKASKQKGRRAKIYAFFCGFLSGSAALAISWLISLILV